MELKLVYRILRGISDWALDSFFSEVAVEGSENVPKEGPIIFAPSHHNEIIDIAALSATAPHRRIIAYWAKASLFTNPIAGSILSSSGAIPVRRGGDNGSTSSNDVGKGGGRADLYESTVRVLTGRHTHSASKKSRRWDAKEKRGRSGAVGIFAEGASYTEPRIVQVKEGTAWAAVEVWRARHGGKDIEHGEEGHGEHEGITNGEASPLLRKNGSTESELVIVPVGIVYTDKSVYRSRVHVRYGKPIPISPYLSSVAPLPQSSSSSSSSLVAAESGRSISASVSSTSAGHTDPARTDSEAERAVVKRLTSDIEKALLELTINAPDWDSLYASRMLADILFEDEKTIPLIEFPEVSQRLVDLVASPPSSATTHLKQTLLHYHALLYHTSLTHSSLTFLPLPPSSHTSSSPPQAPPPNLSPRTLLRPILRTLLNLLHPSHLFFLPTLPLHLPSYIFASLAKSHLGDPAEEEARAQFMVVAGGLGLCVGYGAGMVGGWYALGRVLREGTWSAARRGVWRVVEGVGLDAVRVDGVLVGLGEWTGKWVRDWSIGRAVGIVGVLFALSWLHAALIDRNLRLFNRFHALYLLTSSLLCSPLPSSKLAPYLLTPRPAINPFIKRIEPVSDQVVDRFSPPPKVSPRRLIQHVVKARWDAVGEVRKVFGRLDEEGMVTMTGGSGGVGEELRNYLWSCGARI